MLTTFEIARCALFMLCGWHCSFLCCWKSGHWFIDNIVDQNVSARSKWVWYHPCILIPKLIHLWILVWLLHFIFHIVVTRSPRLCEYRWKSNEGYMSSWRWVSFMSLLVYTKAFLFLSTIVVTCTLHFYISYVHERIKTSQATFWGYYCNTVGALNIIWTKCGRTYLAYCLAMVCFAIFNYQHEAEFLLKGFIFYQSVIQFDPIFIQFDPI